MKYIELLVFDLDGTLVDSKVDIIRAVNRTLERFQIAALPDSAIEPYIGIGVQPLIRQTLLDHGQSKIEEAFAVFKSTYFRQSCVDTELYPGVEKALRHYAHIPKVVLTNKASEFIEPILTKLEIYHYFVECYGRNSFPTMKPDPGPLLAIGREFGIALEKILIVGDTEADMLAGKRAGTLTCAATYGYGKAEKLVSLDPDFTIQKAMDLIGVLDIGN